DVQKTRLRGWLVAAVLLLLIIALVSPQQLPVVVYKLSLISLAAVLGYWLDRSLFPKARPGQYLKHDERLMAEGRWPVQTGLHLVFSAALIRRALIVAAVCLAVAMGL
ncbi:putative holin, partial [Escherichia coli]|nr:putative holin [Escherichia coli]EKB5154036.1 putative holin [Escherichia coli]EKI8620591.1 putative holin [Escherichia coli]